MLKRRDILWDPMPLSQVVAFYLGIPVVMAIMFGINHAGLARHLTIPAGLWYWLGVWVPFWLMLDVGTRASAFVLRPWSPPLWLILLLGATVAVLISRPYVGWYVGRYMAALTPGTYAPVPSLTGVWRELDRAIAFAGTPAFWIAVNYYYDRTLGIPRYRGRLLEMNAAPSTPAIAPNAVPVWTDGAALAPTLAVADGGPGPPAAVPRADADLTTPVATSDAPSPLLSLVPAKLGTDVMALQAEDHYVRVHTTRGSALIRYRFGDALREAETLDGLQVHRSFWVRRRHVTDIDRQGGQWAVILSNGERIPVSQGFRGSVRAARLPGTQ